MDNSSLILQNQTHIKRERPTGGVILPPTLLVDGFNKSCHCLGSIGISGVSKRLTNVAIIVLLYFKGSCFARRRLLTVDHESLSRRSTVPTPNRYTSKHLGAHYVVSMYNM